MITQPFHKRFRPTPQNVLLFEFNRIDLIFAHLSPYSERDSSGLIPDSRPLANSLFDGRAAAAVSASVGDPVSVRIEPRIGLISDPEAILESKIYFNVAPSIFILTAKCLAVMAYTDYFPDAPYAEFLRPKVSEAIMQAAPGWCGSYGPDIGDQGQPNGLEGNYDFAQMFMLPLVYNFYDELTSDARERLITLLALGRIHRANLDDTVTSGGAPNDWELAGWGAVAGQNIIPIPESENHVLMIATARYLSNQLLYQRGYDSSHDNRRNGGDSRPSCMDQVLGLLRNYLRDDFAEYNAKNYQEETRHALLNLCSYAYDAEVRLGARMVLDYISAHIAVSSNDLRRMVPFRRRDEEKNVHQIPGKPGFMDVSLLDANGADPMPAQFALLAGNTRTYKNPNMRVWPPDTKAVRPWPWAITANFGSELTLGALSSYRMPPSIHDLFVNDLHRRFFQRIHRHPLEEQGGQRNCENMEIYAGSPSYLITAGGKPSPYAIFGVTIAGVKIGYDETNKGVAVPISFMPTGLSAANYLSLQELASSAGMSARPIRLKAVASKFGLSVPFSLRELYTATVNTSNARDLIQLLRFSDKYQIDDHHYGDTENYGVAPDFACGFAFYFPNWANISHDQDGLFFVNRKSAGAELAGFYLAIIKQDEFVLLEAFDTWLHPEVSFESFQKHVMRDNPNIQFRSGQETKYTTFFGNKIHFVIWRVGEQDGHDFGSKILNIEYGAGDPVDTLVGSVSYTDQSQFLNGTILNSAGDAVTEIHNPYLGTNITLNWSDPSHLVRILENGEVEEAGKNAAGQWCEVWVDFDWSGDQDGDFYHPFKTLAGAVAAVADRGTIKIMPGTTSERSIIHPGKRIRLVAPIGGVTIGAS